MDTTARLNLSEGVGYKKLHRLGDGSFGDVYLVEEVATGLHFVSKEIKLTNLDVRSTGKHGYAAFHRGEGS